MQVKLDDKNNPNNVNWYKVNQETGEDMKIEASDSIEIKKNKGKFRDFISILWYILA